MKYFLTLIAWILSLSYLHVHAQEVGDVVIGDHIKLKSHLQISYDNNITFKATFSRDEQYMAVSLYGSGNGSGVGLWDMNSSEMIDSVMFSYMSYVTPRVTFNRYGDEILIAPQNADSVIKWDFGKTTPPLSRASALLLIEPTAWSPLFLLTPDEKEIYFTSSRHPLTRINLTTFDTVQRLEGHTGLIWSMEYNPDSTRIATVSVDRSVRIWNVATGEQELLLTYSDSWFPFSAIFSPDGSRLLISSGGNLAQESVLQEFDSYTGDVIRDYSKPDSVFFLSTPYYYSPDGKTVVAINEIDSSLVFWETETGSFLGEYKIDLQGNLTWIAFSPKGTYLAAGGLNEPVIRVWKWEYLGSSVEEKVAGERQLTLHNIHPNPTQGHIEIPFTLAQPQNVSLSLIDVSGRPVGESREMMYEAGKQSASWNVENLPSGIYYVLLTTAGERQMKPVQVVH